MGGIGYERDGGACAWLQYLRDKVCMYEVALLYCTLVKLHFRLQENGSRESGVEIF